MMMKRKKRVVEYARYMTARNKGDKLDKKTSEQGEQFMALNETLKSELPRLFELSNQLVNTCLKSFVNLQVSWTSIWQRKMRTILEETADSVPQIDEILEAFNSDFNYVEAHVLSLGVCNGALLNDVNNFLSSSAASFSANDTASTSRPSYNRSSAASGTQSPRIPAPEFDRRSGSGFNIPSFSGRTSSESQHRPQQQQHGQSYYQERFRANSNVSNGVGSNQETPRSAPYVPHQQRSGELRPQRSHQQSQWQQQTQPAPRASPPPPYLQPQTHSQSQHNVSQRPTSASTFYSTTQGLPAGSTPNLSQQRQKSDAFSSAMPLSDSPQDSRPVTPDAAPGQREREPRNEYKVLFTAASLYDFNLKQDRYEAGYPYLFYSPGEVSVSSDRHFVCKRVLTSPLDLRHHRHQRRALAGSEPGRSGL
jgi:dynamin-binding protein